MDTSGDIKKFFFVINHAKNMRDRKNVFFLKQDPDPGSGFNILICRIRIRPKMDRIRNLATYRTYLFSAPPIRYLISVLMLQESQSPDTATQREVQQKLEQLNNVRIAS